MRTTAGRGSLVKLGIYLVEVLLEGYGDYTVPSDS